MQSPIQSVPVQRGLSRMLERNAVGQSGCNWLRCAGVVATCVTACVAGPGSAPCIACLGSAYDSCKDCF
jgi:hypothetical protein